jgi:hypothetical protein
MVRGVTRGTCARVSRSVPGSRASELSHRLVRLVGRPMLLAKMRRADAKFNAATRRKKALPQRQDHPFCFRVHMLL